MRPRPFVCSLAIIIFAFVFFVFSLRQRNDSAQSKSIAYGVALLMLMQIVFVWMANTNRMIFFGQDFPFMSQNARATMILFVVLLFIMMMASSNREPEIEKEGRLSIEGFHYFNKRPFKIFCVFVVLVFGIVFFTGNNYSNLYETSEAKTFSAGEAINQAEKDFEKINEILATYPASKPLKPHGENLTSLFQKINNKIGLDDFVDKLEQDKQIGSFSASLYRAFRNNLQRDNRVDNIVHLQYIDASDSYRFAINNGFYSLRAPEMQKTLWSGNVYAYDDDDNIITTLVEGKISFASESLGKTIDMSPNEQVKYNKVKKELSIERVREVWKEVSWTEGLIHFEPATLGEILRRMKNVYGVTFVCEDKDALNITYKVTFYNGESLDQFISVVNKMANLKSSREGNYVYFRKEITK